MLLGGDEFRPQCEPVDRYLLASIGKPRPHVLVLPTAAAAERPELAASNGVNYFSRLGAKAEPLMVLNTRDANDPMLSEKALEADILYLTGGNPHHLLEALQNSLLLSTMSKLLEADGTLAGSSAGAMVMGSYMRSRSGEWTRALDIIKGVAVLPHHERADPSQVASQLIESAPERLHILGIDAQTGCLIAPAGCIALGNGRVILYKEGQWQSFYSGQQIPLNL